MTYFFSFLFFCFSRIREKFTSIFPNYSPSDIKFRWVLFNLPSVALFISFYVAEYSSRPEKVSRIRLAISESFFPIFLANFQASDILFAYFFNASLLAIAFFSELVSIGGLWRRYYITVLVNL